MLNEVFISIKVDREERPDIDDVYMKVCQLVTGSGGWPLTILMAPDKTPFYAATYIPKEGRYGRGGLMEIVPQVGTLWENTQGGTACRGKKHVDRLRRMTSAGGGTDLDEETLQRGF